MKKSIIILFIAMTLILGCTQNNEPESKDDIIKDSTILIDKPENNTLPTQDEFCGTSTNSPCKIDSDCKSGGCSGHICQGTSEKSAITICDYKECYDREKYNMTCRCTESRCQWS